VKKEHHSSPTLVAITGGSGSGKSWLAGRLGERLGAEAGVIALDDFYRDRSHLSPARRSRINFDHPRAIRWNLFEQVLQALNAGERVELPIYSFATHSCVAGSKPWEPGRIVLVEGLWLLRRPSIRRQFSFSIYLECSDEIRFRRKLERDQAQRGRSEEFAKQQFETMTLPMHRRYVAPQTRWADVVLKTPIAENEIDLLAERLRGL
jgi:uridine kinase